jgi:putative ABC transport system permease protein
MITNYFKTSWRNLSRNFGYSLINVLGLTVGIAGCILIMLFVLDELSYDRFHEHHKRIYRLVGHDPQFGDNARVHPRLGELLAKSYPEITASVILDKEEVVFQHQDELIPEPQFIFTEPSFFKLFDFPLLQGSTSDALSRLNTLVITESSAEKYFNTKEVIGRKLETNDGTIYEISGVIADPPHNSHIQFDFLSRYVNDNDSPFMRPIFLYLMMNDPQTAETFLSKLNHDYSDEDKSELFGFWVKDLSFSLQPIRKIHLYSQMRGELVTNSDIKYIYIFSAVALFLLLIAALNYANLSTVLAVPRAKEVSVRKVVGANKSQVVQQFLTEAFLLSFLALVLSLVLVEILLPFMNQITDKTLSVGYSSRLWLPLAFIVLTGAVALLAGTYPAFYLSKFQPVDAFKSVSGRHSSGARIWKFLIVTQFIIAVVSIALTMIMVKQMHFIQHSRLGFDEENILMLPIPREMRQARLTAQAQLGAVPGITAVSICNGSPLAGLETTFTDDGPLTRLLFADDVFLKTMGFRLLEGQSLSLKEVPESYALVYINETARRVYNLSEYVGGQLPNAYSQIVDGSGFLAGVVEDFYTGSFHEPIKPVIIYVTESERFAYSFAVRFQTEDIRSLLEGIENIWDNFVLSVPFQYNFLDTEIDALYESDRKLVAIFNRFSVVTMFLACLGLFGLAGYTAQQRTKEIGIRKVLGASIPDILILITKDYLLLVIIALFIALPFAFFAGKRWLQDFAYQIDITPEIFLMTGITAVILALLAVGGQAFHAARINPSETIRYE